MMRTSRFLLFILGLLAAGCAQIPLGEPVATIDNIQRARAAKMQPVSVGAFVPAKELDPADDVSINIRTNDVFSPFDKSFAKYLRHTLISELKAAGVYAEDSNVLIEGELTRSKAEAPSDRGSAELAARFRVLRDGAQVYAKELQVSHSWESSFVGVVAIPIAIGEYTTLYRKLVGKLLDDSEFRKAVAQ